MAKYLVSALLLKSVLKGVRPLLQMDLTPLSIGKAGRNG